MRNKIVKDLKKCIRSNLEDRICQIMNNTDKVRLLSKRDMISILKFMKKEHIYSKSILEYIYIKSIHRYLSKPSLPNLNNDVLIDAVEKGNFDVVKFLLSNKIRELSKARINPSADNNEALLSACQKGHMEIVKLLLSRKIVKRFPRIDPCVNYNSPMRLAIENCHLDILKYLLSDEITKRFPKIDTQYAIRSACEYGHLDIVEFLLSSEVVALFPEIDENINSGILFACANGHLNVVKILLEDEMLTIFPKINPKVLNNEAIRLAHHFYHPEIVEFLRINFYNSAPLSDILPKIKFDLLKD